MTKVSVRAEQVRAGRTPAGDGRDVRLDLFRGLANWTIFLDHIPNNAVAWLTTRNYGFSDAADLFVFISGYTAALAYSKAMRRDGFWAGAVKLMRRVWQLYVAHILLFVVYVAAIGWVAQTYRHSHLLDEFNVAGLIANPIEYLTAGLLLKFKPLNMDVLPLYIVLMAVFPVVLRAMLARPNTTLFCSLSLYVFARLLGWNLPAWPEGVWYFNPFAWQLLFVLGAWCALGGAKQLHWLLTSPAVLRFCILYLVFALIVALPQNLGMQSSALAWLSDGLAIDDKTNLAPSRLLHFIALAVLTISLVPRDRPWLRSPLLRPINALRTPIAGGFLRRYFPVVRRSFLARTHLQFFADADRGEHRRYRPSNCCRLAEILAGQE